MKVKTFKTGDVVCLKNNLDLKLIVLSLTTKNNITVVFPDGITKRTYPQTIFTKQDDSFDFKVTLNLNA